MHATHRVSLAVVMLAAASGCGASGSAARETVTEPPGSFGEELLSKPVEGVDDCLSGYSTGLIGDYVAGGGDPTADVAIGYLTRDVGREWRVALQPRIVARSDSMVIVEYSHESRVVARGAVQLVDDKWQMEGLSTCTKYPAAKDGPPVEDEDGARDH